MNAVRPIRDPGRAVEPVALSEPHIDFDDAAKECGRYSHLHPHEKLGDWRTRIDGVTVQLLLAPAAVRRQAYVDDDVKRWSTQCQAALSERQACLNTANDNRLSPTTSSSRTHAKHGQTWRQPDRRGALLDTDPRAGFLAAVPRSGRCQANPTITPPITIGCAGPGLLPSCLDLRPGWFARI